jgi:hypothetical protein
MAGQLTMAGLLLVAAVVGLLRHAFKRLTVLLYMSEAARIGIPFDVLFCHRIKGLAALANRSNTEPLTSICCHIDPQSYSERDIGTLNFENKMLCLMTL